MDDAWWLAIIAFLIVAGAVALAGVFGLTQNLLLLYAFLAGILSALYIANDERILQGRPAIEGQERTREAPLLPCSHLLVIAGFTGAILGWIVTPILDFTLASFLDYNHNLLQDMRQAYEARIQLVSLPIPGFLFTGLSSLTTSYLYLILLHKYKAVTFAILSSLPILGNAVVGYVFYTETLLPIEWVLIIALLCLLILLSIYKASLANAQQGLGEVPDVSVHRQGFIFWGLAALYVFLSLTTTWSIRDTLSPFRGQHQVFVSLYYRVWYFSVYTLPFLAWVAHRLIWRKSGRTVYRLRIRDYFIVLITPLIFSSSYALYTTALAGNLSKVPLVEYVGLALIAPIAAGLYKINSTAKSPQDRIIEMFIPQTAVGVGKFRYVTLYCLFLVVVILLFVQRMSVHLPQ